MYVFTFDQNTLQLDPLWPNQGASLAEAEKTGLDFTTLFSSGTRSSGDATPHGSAFYYNSPKTGSFVEYYE